MTQKPEDEAELTAKDVPNDREPSAPSKNSIGRLPSQGAFTHYGCDLTTGEPLFEMAGLGQVRK